MSSGYNLPEHILQYQEKGGNAAKWLENPLMFQFCRQIMHLLFCHYHISSSTHTHTPLWIALRWDQMKRKASHTHLTCIKTPVWLAVWNDSRLHLWVSGSLSSNIKDRDPRLPLSLIVSNSLTHSLPFSRSISLSPLFPFHSLSPSLSLPFTLSFLSFPFTPFHLSLLCTCSPSRFLSPYFPSSPQSLL